MARLIPIWIGASTVAMILVAILTPVAPSIVAAAKPCPSAKPPLAIKGTVLTSPTQEDNVGDFKLADVSSTFQPIDNEEVDPKLDSALSVADGGAFMDHQTSVSLVMLDDQARRNACCFKDPHSFLDGGLDIGTVIRWV